MKRSPCGWVDRRRDHGGVIFLDMRDRGASCRWCSTPTPRSIFSAPTGCAVKYPENHRPVRARSAATVNPAMATGAIEVLGKELEILNHCPHPFQLDEYTAVGGFVRLQYRYMDLRRQEMQQRLILRSRITSAVRSFLDGEGFLDIETPILTAPRLKAPGITWCPAAPIPANFSRCPSPRSCSSSC